VAGGGSYGWCRVVECLETLSKKPDAGACLASVHAGGVDDDDEADNEEWEVGGVDVIDSPELNSDDTRGCGRCEWLLMLAKVKCRLLSLLLLLLFLVVVGGVGKCIQSRKSCIGAAGVVGCSANRSRR
jgi:hypothetical protein